MREIKFRGKTQYGEWVEGSYLQTDDNTNNPLQHHPLNLRHQIWSYWSGDWNMGGWSPMDVLPETIGQFTGLTDITGKELYEGDIVEIGETQEIVLIKDIRYMSNLLYQHLERGIYLKYIGNIHENPELTK